MNLPSLFPAVGQGDIGAVKGLLDEHPLLVSVRNTDLDSWDEQTPLNAGADHLATDAREKSALDHARSNNNQNILAVLQAHRPG